MMNLSALILMMIPAAFAAPDDGATHDPGDDFSNNLFSDLAPLLALFGEQVAKQFMSQSMYWMEHVIFAMAPLGILTAIVSAIRVGGPSWLRAVVGRARENLATVEMELMSSTSHEVCELWNGQGIVRAMGIPEVQQILYFEQDRNDISTCGLHTIETALKAGLIKSEPYEDPGVTYFKRLLSAVKKLIGKNNTNDVEAGENASEVHSATGDITDSTQDGSIRTHYDDDFDVSSYQSAPNISLNLHGGPRFKELYLAMIFGTLLQSGMLVFSAFAVYHPSFKQRFPKDDVVQGYAFPVMASGTIILTIGILLCSVVVEQSTQEKSFVPNEEKVQAGFRVLWLQRYHTVNDQTFEPFALFAQDEFNSRDRIMTSTRRTGTAPKLENTNADFPKPATHSYNSTSDVRKNARKRHEWASKVALSLASSKTEALTLLAVLFSLCGFILQFQGLRGLNWSASIAQLVCIVLMTVVRAVVRRGLIKEPIVQRLRREYEMDWLALTITGSSSFPPTVEKTEKEKASRSTFMTFKVHSGEKNVAQLGDFKDESSEAPPEANLTQPRYFSENSKETPEPQYLVKVRERLGRLTRWKGPAYAGSIAVADSIEAMMDIVFPDKKKFIWKLAVGTEEGETTSGQTKYIEFVVKKERAGWSIDATLIEAAMSLWLYHIHKTKRQQITAEKNDWLRSEKPFKNKIVRLLGRNTDLDRTLLKWWIGDDFGQQDTPTHPEPTLSKSTASGGGGTKHICLGFFTSKEQDESSVAMITESNASLESAVAQHIFTSFMWAVAKNIDTSMIDQKDETLVLRGNQFRMDDPETLLSLGLENKTVASIANAIEKAGLGTLQEAYMCILPPLGYFGKLPVEGVVEFTWKQMREHELRSDWKLIVPISVQLFHKCKPFGSGHPAFLQAAAILIYVFFSVRDRLNHLQGQQRTDGVEVLIEAQHKITAASNLANKDEIQQLAGLPYLKTRLRSNSFREFAAHAQESTLISKSSNEHSFLNHNKALKLMNETRGWSRPVGLDFGTCRNDLRASNEFGWTPLYYAVVIGNASHVKSALDYGADPNATDLAEWTPLHYAFDLADQGSSNSALESVIWTLLRGGADIEMHGKDGTRALHYAARRSHASATKVLLEAGANVHVLDNSRKTPLHCAAYAGSGPIVKDLLEKGADKGARDDYGRIPLHLAAVKGKYEAVEELMMVGKEFEYSAKDLDGRTPLHLAAMGGNAKVVDRLLGRDGDERKNGKSPSSEKPKDSGISAKAGMKDKNECTALNLATVFGHVAVVQILLERKLAEGDRNDSAATILHKNKLTVLSIGTLLGRKELVRMDALKQILNTSSGKELDLAKKMYVVYLSL